ncbi:MAG: hypothetical protein J6S84_05050 [Bacteroidales bacterium]|nr:hypothetical protein [Bacteroidales bacterium]
MRRFNLRGYRDMDTEAMRYPVVGKVVLALFIYIFTFPAFAPDLAPGLDASYVWGLNWLFANDYSQLSQLIYPIGPLALLKLPAIEGANFIIFLVVYSILKIWFISACFKLAEFHSKNFYCAAALIMLASYFAGIDLMIIFLCIILCFFAVKQNSTFKFVVASLLAFLGLFIKTSIGVEALSVLFVAWIMDFYKNRSFKRLFKEAFLVVASALVVGMAVLHDFAILIDYFWGELHLVAGYGGALSLHPDNNWTALIIFISIIVLFPLLSGDKDSKILFFLSLIPLFASWKHSFVREDIQHYQAIVTFVIVFWSVILLSKTIRRGFAVACAMLAVMMLYWNMKEVPGYKGKTVEYCGINNFIGTVCEYNVFAERMTSLTDNALACDKLPDEVVAKIGNYTIDFYPWEHMYAKVNALNWHPRKTIEIGASTSKWLSDVASENFAGKNAVEYVLWHFVKDGFTIDGRYPLNDEPNVVYNILQNYNADYYGDNYIVWKKLPEGRLISQDVGDVLTARFNEWISVPDCGEYIQRIKIESGVNFTGFVKKTFFKDEMYFVDYMTHSGEIFTYRYVPSTAVDGLWINPLVEDFVSGELADKVDKVRFRVSDERCVKGKISVQFETLNVSLGEIVKIVKDSSVALYMNNFETLEPRNTDAYAFSGKFSNVIEPQGFSCTYSLQMDSLWSMVADSSDIDLKASCKFLNTGSSHLVVSIDGNEKSLYECRYLGNTGSDLWSSANLKCRISRDDYPSGILKVYVWNNGNCQTYIDDMKVSYVESLKELP